jgi:hypothetical protein
MLRVLQEAYVLRQYTHYKTYGVSVLTNICSTDKQLPISTVDPALLAISPSVRTNSRTETTGNRVRSNELDFDLLNHDSWGQCDLDRGSAEVEDTYNFNTNRKTVHNSDNINAELDALEEEDDGDDDGNDDNNDDDDDDDNDDVQLADDEHRSDDEDERSDLGHRVELDHDAPIFGISHAFPQFTH